MAPPDDCRTPVRGNIGVFRLFMLLHVMFVSEFAFTLIAGKLFSRMFPHVSLPAKFPRERQGAYLTYVMVS